MPLEPAPRLCWPPNELLVLSWLVLAPLPLHRVLETFGMYEAAQGQTVEGRSDIGDLLGLVVRDDGGGAGRGGVTHALVHAHHARRLGDGPVAHHHAAVAEVAGGVGSLHVQQGGAVGVGADQHLTEATLDPGVALVDAVGDAVGVTAAFQGHHDADLQAVVQSGRAREPDFVVALDVDVLALHAAGGYLPPLVAGADGAVVAVLEFLLLPGANDPPLGVAADVQLDLLSGGSGAGGQHAGGNQRGAGAKNLLHGISSLWPCDDDPQWPQPLSK